MLIYVRTAKFVICASAIASWPNLLEELIYQQCVSEAVTHCAFSLFDWSFFQIKRGPIGRLASASGFAITCANDHHTSGHDAAVSFYAERTASVYSHQADEVRASKLIGTKVINTANETLATSTRSFWAKMARLLP